MSATIKKFPENARVRKSDAETVASKKSEDSSEEAFENFGIKSFRREYRRLRKMTTSSSEDFTSSGAAFALTRSLLAMVIQAMPVAERSVHKYRNERSIYGLNALIASARELSSDLRTFGDQTENVNRVREVVVQGGFRILATSIVQDVIKARQELYGKLPPKTAAHVDKRLRLLQEGLVHHFSKAEAEVAAQISKVMTTR